MHVRQPSRLTSCKEREKAANRPAGDVSGRPSLGLEVHMMEPTDDRTTGPTDEELLTALREVAGRADPAPDEVILAARSAIAYRRMDAELAELLYDSAVEDDHL